MTVSFSSKLMRPGAVGAWTFALVPRTAAAEARLRARMRVRGTIDGVPFGSSLMPRGGGEIFIVVNGELRERIGKAAGATVRVELEVDLKPEVIPVPPALRRALAQNPKAAAVFQAFAPSRRKAYIQWVAGAKQEPTRERRIARAVKMIGRGEKLN